MTVEQTFVECAVEKLAENMDCISSCLERFPPDLLWARHSENENAVGNLLLHLEGNVRQWILAGLGGREDHRDRDSEFAARSGATGQELVARLGGTVEEALHVIGTMPHRRLPQPVAIQGYDTTVLGAIFHVVEHFGGHTYQIILMTKRSTGDDLGFYAYLSQTGRREPAAGA